MLEFAHHLLNYIYIFEKLHFTALNYTSYYTFYPIFFECTFCTMNYDPYYTLHPNVKCVNLVENSKFRVQSVIRSIVYDGKV